MKNLLCFCILVIVFSANANAATYWFTNRDANEPNNWNSTSNWLDAYLQPADKVPAATDSGQFTFNNFKCFLDTTLSIRYLDCPYGGTGGRLVIENDGNLTVTKTWNMATVSGASGIIDINEGGVVNLTAVNVPISLTVGNGGDGLLNVRGKLNGKNDMQISYGMTNDEGVPSSGVVNVYSNGKIQNFRTIYLGVLATNNLGILNINDVNSSVSCETVYVGNGGKGRVNIHDGLLKCSKYIIAPWGAVDPEMGGQYSDANMILTGNGRVAMPKGTFLMSALEGSGPSVLTVYDPNCVFDCNTIIAGQGGAATINISNGIIECNSLYLTWVTENSIASCQVNLFGGTINVTQNWWPGYNSKRYYEDYGHDDVHVDIRNSGKLVVPYPYMPEIIEDVNLGIVKAYGGAGFVKVIPDADANTCTLTACMDDVAGDITGDCKVNYDDISTLAANWLSVKLNPASLDNDPNTNFKDYSVIANDWFLDE